MLVSHARARGTVLGCLFVPDQRLIKSGNYHWIGTAEPDLADLVVYRLSLPQQHVLALYRHRHNCPSSATGGI